MAWARAVAARLDSHLEALKGRFLELLGSCEIQESAEPITPSGSLLPKQSGKRCWLSWVETPTTTISSPKSPNFRTKQARPTNGRCTTSGRSCIGCRSDLLSRENFPP